LVELLVTISILGMVGALVLPFFVFNSRSLFHSEQKLLINGDIRNLTNSMTENAREANYALLYRSFYAQTTSTGLSVSRDQNGDGSITALDRRAGNEAGDFLLLVYTDDRGLNDPLFYDGIPNNEPTNDVRVRRMVGYWIAPNRNEPGTSKRALYMFDTDEHRVGNATGVTTPWGATFPATLSTTVTIESLLPPATSAAATNSTYAELLLNDVEGRATAAQNFVNYGNKSIGIKSRVLHGNLAKRVTNTYNFAITPRG
jgi:type II secretory pathway pseudopilin PulG